MVSHKKTKFNVGDEVTVISSAANGVIKNIVSYLGEGDNIYLVDVDGKEKVYVETNLSINRKKNVAINLNVSDIGINFEIEDKIQYIIDILNLKNTTNEEEQLLNASKLQAYLVLNDEYEDNNIKIGNSVIRNELYHGLINGDSDSIGNSYVFSEVLRKIGMDVLNVGLNTTDSEFHMANLVLIGKNYYYFDVTLEMAVFNDNGANEEDFVLCCGALGKKSYEQFFKPLGIMEFNVELSPDNLPENISDDDIDIDLVNKLLILDNEKREEV